MAGTAAHLVARVLPARAVAHLLGGAASALPALEAKAEDGTLRFEAAPSPSSEELQETLRYVHARVMKWLARCGLFREADASNEAPSYSAGEAMTLAGMPRCSPPTMISHASDCAATSRVRPSRWRAWACVATAS